MVGMVVITLLMENQFLLKKTTYNTVINGTPVVCFVKTIHDYDSDHGHRYDWNREDLYFNVTVFGIMMEIEALPYIEKGLLSLVP